MVTENHTLQEILAAIKENCESKVTSDNLKANLDTFEQGENTADFCQKLDKITTQLKPAYLTDNIPQKTA